MLIRSHEVRGKNKEKKRKDGRRVCINLTSRKKRRRQKNRQAVGQKKGSWNNNNHNSGFVFLV